MELYSQMKLPFWTKQWISHTWGIILESNLKNDGTNWFSEDRTALSYWMNYLVPLEKDLVLKEQETRKTEPFQQEYCTTCANKIFFFCRNMASWKENCLMVGYLPCLSNIAILHDLDIARFDMNSAFKKGGCKLKSALHMAQEYCVLEGIHIIWKKIALFQKRMLNLLEDSSIICRGIACWKNIVLSQRKIGN